MQTTNPKDIRAKQRQKQLIDSISSNGVLHLNGRSLESLTLPELENLNIEVLNDFARSYYGGD